MFPLLNAFASLRPLSLDVVLVLVVVPLPVSFFAAADAAVVVV